MREYLRALRLTNKLADLRAANAAQRTYVPVPKLEFPRNITKERPIGLLLGLLQKASLGKPGIHAQREYLRALRLTNKLADLRAANAAQRTYVPVPKLEFPRNITKERPIGRSFVIWWGKLDSDQRSQ